MNRWKAFALHLLLSLTLITGIALTALLTWYPHGLYRISGLDRLLLVMLCIDVTAGPLLTLVIYRPGKWGLGFDLKAIALVQAAFLAYGLHTLWQARPVFLVGSGVRFNLISAAEIDPQDLAKASRPEWRKLPWTGPHLVGVAPPDDPQERQRLLWLYMDTGRDLEKLPEQYQPYEAVVQRIRDGAQPFDGRDGTPALPGRKGLPVMGRMDEAWLVIDPASGRPDKVVRR